MVFYKMNEPTHEPISQSDAAAGHSGPSGAAALDRARATIDCVRTRIRYDVMGRDEVIDLVLVAMFSGGHVLLEDYPGSGKTTLAKALGHALGDAPAQKELANFRRIQFTPDLLPSDVTGVMIFDPQTNEFHFRRGPVFAHIVLVDEINRTSPKVQAALLESMGERQVTVDNVSYILDDLFFVIATQNPLDSIGTYPLPVAQLDRFLFKIRMEHIDKASELEVLEQWGAPRAEVTLDTVTRDAVLDARRTIQNTVQVDGRIRECLVDIASAIRADGRTAQGVSTRSLVQAIPALQTRALMDGRNYVTSADIDALVIPLFQHRISVVPGAGDSDEIVADAIKGPIETLTRSTR
jgi:MoxR-like ATPase